MCCHTSGNLYFCRKAEEHPNRHLVKKTYIIPLIATFTFALGTVAMALPFLPFGWALYGATVLILMPYFPFLQKAYKWMASKDGTGTALKAGEKVAELYRWADKEHVAQEIKDVNDEADNGK